MNSKGQVHSANKGALAAVTHRWGWGPEGPCAPAPPPPPPPPPPPRECELRSQREGGSWRQLSSGLWLQLRSRLRDPSTLPLMLESPLHHSLPPVTGALGLSYSKHFHDLIANPSPAYPSYFIRYNCSCCLMLPIFMSSSSQNINIKISI